MSWKEIAKQILVKAAFLGVVDISKNKKGDKMLEHVNHETFIKVTRLHCSCSHLGVQTLTEV